MCPINQLSSCDLSTRLSSFVQLSDYSFVIWKNDKKLFACVQFCLLFEMLQALIEDYENMTILVSPKI